MIYFEQQNLTLVYGLLFALYILLLLTAALLLSSYTSVVQPVCREKNSKKLLKTERFVSKIL